MGIRWGKLNSDSQLWLIQREGLHSLICSWVRSVCEGVDGTCVAPKGSRPAHMWYTLSGDSPKQYLKNLYFTQYTLAGNWTLSRTANVTELLLFSG